MELSHPPGTIIKNRRTAMNLRTARGFAKTSVYVERETQTKIVASEECYAKIVRHRQQK